MARKLPYEYYAAAKTLLKNITGVPIRALGEISSRNGVNFFDPDMVGLYIDPWYKQDKYANNLLKSKIADIQNSIRNVSIDEDEYGYLVISIPKEVIEELDYFQGATEKDKISFWVAIVYDYSSTRAAYGAKIQSVDGFIFPTNIGRIQQKLGEESYYEYCKGGVKYFRTYGELCKFLKNISSYGKVPSEDKLIESAWDERYYVI